MTKTVFITGANRGIGLELARLHKAAGWNVLATFRDESTSSELRDLLGADKVHQLDVKDQNAISKLPQFIAEHSGCLHRLINNAGVFGPRSNEGEDFAQIATAEWLDTFHVNAVAPVQIAKSLQGLLASTQPDGEGADTKCPQIVNISSRMGSVENCGTEKSSYAPIYRASKSALNMAMTCLAADVQGLGIGVYLMHPGWVQTAMGGENADLSVQKSAFNLFSTMNNFSLSQSGGFFNHDGTKILW
ncbi:MAG: SDR family oxidoreductase [Alphaproteobacteria bacterium]